ncbi:hypothetical protein FRC11_014953, partial [Ceratobasidium sp. 423]
MGCGNGIRYIPPSIVGTTANLAAATNSISPTKDSIVRLAAASGWRAKFSWDIIPSDLDDPSEGGCQENVNNPTASSLAFGLPAAPGNPIAKFTNLIGSSHKVTPYDDRTSSSLVELGSNLGATTSTMEVGTSDSGVTRTAFTRSDSDPYVM